jgi:tetratricopeptide (TPR) repeat protein
MMTTSHIRALLLALLLLAPCFASDARAQPSESNDAIARAHFLAATGYFDTGDYESALREFERAYALTQYPRLLYNLYACHERLGQLEPAITRLEQFLAAEPGAENHAALEERLANLRRRVEAQRSPQADVAPTPEAEVQSDVTPVEAAEPPAPSARSIPVIASFSAAGAGVFTFAIAGLLARSEDRELARTCGRDGPRDCTNDEVSGLRRRTITADVGLGVAVAGGVLGLVLVLVQDDDAAVVVGADAREDAASVTFSGRF